MSQVCQSIETRADRRTGRVIAGSCQLHDRLRSADIMTEMARVLPLEPTRPRQPKPEWLKVRAPGSPSYLRLKGLMRDLGLHTVCEQAPCPHIGASRQQRPHNTKLLAD